MRQQAAVFAILYCALFVGDGGAFSTTSSIKCSATRPLSSSSLNLCPGQGNQLVAAYNAKLSSETPSTSSASTNFVPNEHEVTKDESKRSFLTRVFQIPSGSIKDHPHPTAEGLPREHQEHYRPNFSLPNFLHPKQKEDIVKYPIVGFRLSKTGENDCIALPTTSSPSCIIPTSQQKQEDLYGWYSSACKLDLFSEDVCHKPIETQQKLP